MDDEALLGFSVGPVQSFIEAAKSLRDLWSGSMLLSWLVCRAAEPLRAEIQNGQARLVYPDLEDSPFWKLADNPPRGRGDERLLQPCLPNKFLAVVPAGEAGRIAQACRKSFQEEWRKIGECAREKLSEVLPPRHGLEGENSLWNRQVEGFFDVRTVILPISEITNETVKRLFGAASKFNSDDHWSTCWRLLNKSLAAQKSIRHFPSYEVRGDEEGRFAAKCSLLGTYEHIGPAEREAAKTFWEKAAKCSIEGTHVDATERLCAISLVKRFAWPAFFAGRFQLHVGERRYRDTATVAATDWLAEAGIDPDAERRKAGHWSGQWLHWNKADQDKDEDRCSDDLFHRIREAKAEIGKPPTYYAILAMDGDKMGDRLNACEREQDHREVSNKLAEFAMNIVPNIVNAKRNDPPQHNGELIYAGGDDVLALLPTKTAIACAAELADAFANHIGNNATMSAGLAIVHYKEDLRFALRKAREAEKVAKSGGRDALHLFVCRRSGEHSNVRCPWKMTGRVTAWVSAFVAGASDRWAYRLMADVETLEQLPTDAMEAELRRQIARSEKATRDWFKEEDMISALEEYRKASKNSGSAGEPRFREFLTLVQTASFLARGRDQ